MSVTTYQPLFVDTESVQYNASMDCQLSHYELGTICGSTKYDPNVLITPVHPDDLETFGCLGPSPFTERREKEIKRLRKLVRKLRKKIS